MSEVMTAPTVTEGANGDPIVTFTAEHSLADIARWIMQNRGEAEDLHMILGQMLDGTYGETMQ